MRASDKWSMFADFVFECLLSFGGLWSVFTGFRSRGSIAFGCFVDMLAALAFSLSLSHCLWPFLLSPC